MFRASAYVLVGWVLIAVVGGLADVFDLTIMLPATSAVVITHAAFAPSSNLSQGLTVAVAMGYLEDLHQGAPIGVLCMAHALTYLALRWLAGRLHLGGWTLRSLVSLAAVVVVDLCTVALLLALADPFGLRRDALLSAIPQVRWHALATLLAAPPVWSLIDRVFVVFRREQPPDAASPWSRR